MIAVAHFMHHVYGPFDAPFRLHPSVGLAACRVAPRARPADHRGAPQRREEAGTPPIETLTPAQARANYVKVAKEQFGEVDEMHAVEDRDADGVPSASTGRRDARSRAWALIYFHGGGWVRRQHRDPRRDHPGARQARRLRRHLASTTGSRPSIRIRPRSTTPGRPRAGCSRHADELGLDPDRIGVGGDSVGGCLATIVARKGRDAGTLFAAQLLIYPTTTSRDRHPVVFALFVELRADPGGDGLVLEAVHRRRPDSGAAEPDISPAALTDLRRLPRAIVVTAEADVLRDEAETYAQRLFLAGVETEGYRYDGMIHGFLRMAGVVERSKPGTRRARRVAAAVLAERWRDDYTAKPGAAASGSCRLRLALEPPLGRRRLVCVCFASAGAAGGSRGSGVMPCASANSR